MSTKNSTEDNNKKKDKLKDPLLRFTPFKNLKTKNVQKVLKKHLLKKELEQLSIDVLALSKQPEEEKPKRSKVSPKQEPVLPVYRSFVLSTSKKSPQPTVSPLLEKGTKPPRPRPHK